eukprot:scaffold143091_cov43-Attheya_sp.AAC.1
MEWRWIGRRRHPTCPPQNHSFSLGVMLGVMLGVLIGAKAAAGWTSPSVSIAQLRAAVLIPPQPSLCCQIWHAFWID